MAGQYLAGGAGEGLLVVADLLQQHLVHAAAGLLHLLHALRLAPQDRQLLLHTMLFVLNSYILIYVIY